jgi:hypothetical protein
VRRDFTHFEDFWLAYPKKKAKGDAEKAWTKINSSELLIEKIISAVQRATTSEDWTKEDGCYIPHPATWLNRRGWEDEYSQLHTGKQLKRAGPTPLEEIKAAEAALSPPSPEDLAMVENLINGLSEKMAVKITREAK